MRKRFEIQKKLKLQAKKDKQAKREAGEASEGEASGSEEDQDVSKDDDADEAAAIAGLATDAILLRYLLLHQYCNFWDKYPVLCDVVASH